MKEIKVLRLDGNDVSWQFSGNDPSNLNASWLKMSFLIIDAGLAKICASSVKSRFFNASLSIFRIPSLKTKIVFFSVGLFLCFFKVF